MTADWTTLDLCSLEICNACDANIMAEGQQDPSMPGLCVECLAEVVR